MIPCYKKMKSVEIEQEKTMAIDSAKAQQQAAALSSQLWSIADDLRGGMDANEFRNYILGTIFYRYLSERTEMYMQEILQEDGIS